MTIESTRIQIAPRLDRDFHHNMTFNPEAFTEMKDKYFLLNGRSYPDTVTAGPLQTMSTDGAMHYSQPLPSIINIPEGGKALLRISDLDVTEYQTLASLGIPMKVIGLNAKLLRDQAGNNMPTVWVEFRSRLFALSVQRRVRRRTEA